MIVPIFNCTDSRSATKFYVEALGFEVLARFQLEEEMDDPAYVTIALNGSHLHLTSFPTNQGNTNQAYVYLNEIHEVDAFYEKIKDRTDLTINIHPVDQTWGLRELGITDPFGNKLTFGAELQGELPTTPAR